jgi:hypothetical protein
MFDPRRYTVPVAKYDDGVPDFQGTGVLFFVDGRYFAVTAMHVLEIGIKKVGFVLPAASGLYEIVGDTTALIVGARALKNSGGPQRAEYKEELDLPALKASDFLAGCARNARVPAIADNLHRTALGELGV